MDQYTSDGERIDEAGGTVTWSQDPAQRALVLLFARHLQAAKLVHRLRSPTRCSTTRQRSSLCDRKNVPDISPGYLRHSSPWAQTVRPMALQYRITSKNS